MNRRAFMKSAGCGALAALLLGARTPAAGAARKHPHIVYIMCDDLGYGDVRCLGEGKIPTPNIDRLAAQGVAFTDAHSGSSVCTPTRYGIMTGRYAWRTHLKRSVLFTDSPPLIPEDRLTVASMLKQRGYRTACVGKWHLGLTFSTTDGEEQRRDNCDFTKPVEGGPCALGFDYYFGIPASLDMEHYYFIENDRVVEPPTREVEGERGIRFHRPGLMAENFSLESVQPAITDKAVDVIGEHAARHDGSPLFLYVPFASPHVPVVPNDEFEGRGKVGAYGDFVAEIDASVGRIMDAIDSNGMTGDTLFIFTSDNGFDQGIDIDDLLAQGHNPSHVFRGYKTDIFEGGHRVPFIARWPGRIAAGTTCDDTICLGDLMATTAELTGYDLPDNAAEDSASFLPALLGQTLQTEREAIVHHSRDGAFAIRHGKWKLIFCPDSGGRSQPRLEQAIQTGLPPLQLYDLEADIAEQNNLHDERPDVVERLTNLMQQYIDNGRSTPGKLQSNEGETPLYRTEAA